MTAAVLLALVAGWGAVTLAVGLVRWRREWRQRRAVAQRLRVEGLRGAGVGS